MVLEDISEEVEGEESDDESTKNRKTLGSGRFDRSTNTRTFTAAASEVTSRKLLPGTATFRIAQLKEDGSKSMSSRRVKTDQDRNTKADGPSKELIDQGHAYDGVSNQNYRHTRIAKIMNIYQEFITDKR